MNLPTLQEWLALKIIERERICREIIDSVPTGQQFPTSLKLFFIDIVFRDSSIVDVMHGINPSFPEDPRHVRCRHACSDEYIGRSWLKKCSPGRSYQNRAARAAFDLYVKPLWPKTDCVDCGGISVDLDHVKPQHIDILDNLPQPWSVRKYDGHDGRGNIFCGPTLTRYVAMHLPSIARLEWVCKSCHKKRTSLRKQ